MLHCLAACDIQWTAAVGPRLHITDGYRAIARSRTAVQDQDSAPRLCSEWHGESGRWNAHSLACGPTDLGHALALLLRQGGSVRVDGGHRKVGGHAHGAVPVLRGDRLSAFTSGRNEAVALRSLERLSDTMRRNGDPKPDARWPQWLLFNLRRRLPSPRGCTRQSTGSSIRTSPCLRVLF